METTMGVVCLKDSSQDIQTTHLCYKTISLYRDQSLNLPIVYSTTHEAPLLQDHLSTETSPSTFP